MSSEELSQAGEIFKKVVFEKYYELASEYKGDLGKPVILTPENLKLVIDSLWLKRNPDDMMEAFMIALGAQKNEN